MSDGPADSLGRAWSFSKLDELLSDPGVQKTVIEAEDAAYGSGGTPSTYSGERLRAWGHAQSRTAPGMALLMLLMLRSWQLDGGSR